MLRVVRCTVAALALVAAIAAVLTPVSALADEPRLTVALSLAPGDASGLARLAARPPRLRSDRRAALAGVAPRVGARGTVRTWLRTHGFRIEGSSPWLVTASAPASTARTLLPDGSVPASLAGVVQAVIGTGPSHSWHRLALPSGAISPTQLAAAYGTPATAQGGGATIATVQFSGWSGLTAAESGIGDLATYAAADGVAMPKVSAVSVNGASVGAEGASGGGIEVALDQEAITGVAPAAAQRVYVTTNDSLGSIRVWDQVLGDVEAGTELTAVSTSWGACEQEVSPAERDATETRLAALDALGVAVFAASGDNGAYDCSSIPQSHTLSVDYPASSPSVVAVGGTTLSGSGTVWSDRGWSGSGGGVSDCFTRPSWQATIAPTLPARRLVPDIAAAADPASGIAVWFTDSSGGSWIRVGGTSLAAPVSAAQYAATMAAAGRPSGLGVDLHPFLYAYPSRFRDVTSGSNGYYAGGRGYDLVTGLGSPQWQALVASMTAPDTTPPRPSASLATYTGRDYRLRLAWSATDPPVGTVAGFDVRLARTAGASSSTAWSSSPASAGSTVVAVTGGAVYRLSVRARDAAGNVSAWVSSLEVAVAFDDTALTHVGRWGVYTNPVTYLGHLSNSTTAGSVVYRRVTGRSAALLAAMTPSSGRIAVYVDGRYLRTVDLYSSRTAWRHVVGLVSWPTVQTHTVLVRVLGAHRGGATGAWVNVDGLVVR